MTPKRTSGTPVCQRARFLGLESRPRGARRRDYTYLHERIRNMWNASWPMEDMARALGISMTTMRRLSKDLPRRKRRSPRRATSSVAAAVEAGTPSTPSS